MNRIEIKFTNGDYITIKLFDNTLSSNLINNFKVFNGDYVLQHSTDDAWENNYSGRYRDKQIITDEWNTILSAIAELKELGIKFTREMNESWDYSQDTLNYLHRVFTYSDLFCVNEVTNETDEFPFTSDYTTPLNITRKELYYITTQINSSVHNLETYASPTDNRNFLTTNKVSEILLKNNGQPDGDGYNTQYYCFNEDEHRGNYNFMKYNESHLVTLSDTILGKSILTSFCNNDNPTLPDCQDRTITDGSFLINPNRTLHDIYNSNGFTKWINTYNMNIDELPLEMAIGYVIESSNPLESFYFENNKNLELSSVNWLSN
tara:strand:- start:292 stop:1251 length:960 start_codon:yes stop_codon:yes gene_type:complete